MRDFKTGAGTGVASRAGGMPGPGIGKRTLTEALGSGQPPMKDDSARFGGDKVMEKVAAGTSTVKPGDHGIEVTKVQQALVDLGYLLPIGGVDGNFGAETQAAVTKFQVAHPPLAPTGALDRPTLARLDAIYDTRKPYLDGANHDPAHPGTRALSAGDQRAAVEAMVPPPGAGGAPAAFTDIVGGKAYADEIRDELTKLIRSLHKELHDDKEPLRADPKKNFHDWSTMEGPGKAAKDVTDKLYGSHYGGSGTFPPMTHKAATSSTSGRMRSRGTPR